MTVQSFSAIPTQIYTSSMAKAAGFYEHEALKYAELLGCQLFDTSYKEEAFRKKLFSENEPTSDCAFLLDTETEKKIVAELNIDDKVTISKIVKKITEVFVRSIFLALTAPISLSLAITGVALRIFVQNQMHPLTAFTPEKPLNITWNGKKPLTICSLNVALTEFAIMNKINGVADTHLRAPQVAQVLKDLDADVICLQEAFDVDTIDATIVDMLKKSGYYGLITSKREQVVGMTGGLLVASKYPIEKVLYKKYTTRVGVDARTGKGVLGVALRLNEKTTVCIGSTHMQAGYPDPKQKITGRIEQFEEARKALNLLAKETGSHDVFLAGDYNIGRYARGKINEAIFKANYEGMVKGLLPEYKDLTEPNKDNSFEEYFEKESSFDTKTAHNNESGEAKGTVFDTTSTSYIYYNRLQKKDEVYVKPNIPDHVAFKRDPEAVFSEVGYQYRRHIPAGPSGILSDHLALCLTVNPK